MRVAVLCAVVLALAGRAGGDEAPESRHWLGVQLGGTNALQLVYRGRVLGPVSVEVGFFGAPPFLLGSLGLVVERPLTRSFWVYAGAGVGGVVAFDEGECDLAAQPDCTDREDWLFYSGRVGVSGPLGPGRLNVDAGFWRGLDRGHAGGEVRQVDPFTIPMAGVSWLVPLPP